MMTQKEARQLGWNIAKFLLNQTCDVDALPRIEAILYFRELIPETDTFLKDIGNDPMGIGFDPKLNRAFFNGTWDYFSHRIKVSNK